MNVKNKNKPKAQILLYMENIKGDFTVDDLKIESGIFKKINEEYDINWPMIIGGEIMAMGEKKLKNNSFDDSKWTFITQNSKKRNFFGDCYLGLIDSLTGNWEYIFDKNDKLFEREALSHILLKSPSYKFTKELKSKIKNGLELINKNKKNRVAIRRWVDSYSRIKSYQDSVLDCCSALEAIFSIRSELRLKVALFSYIIILEKEKKHKAKEVFCNVYRMYRIRNDFIHGNKIPEISVKETKEFIKNTSYIINIILEKKIDCGEDSFINQLQKII